MEDLFKTLPAIMNAFPDSDEIRIAVVGAAWKRAAGEGLSPHSIPLAIENKKLTVAVRDKIWKRNLETVAPELIYKINALVGPGTVRFVEFVHEGITEDMFPKFKTDANEKQISFVLPPDLIAAADKIVDSDLRSKFLSAAQVYLDAKDKRIQNG